MIIKTIASKYIEIESAIKEVINYDNFIGEIKVSKVNSNFESWLNSIVN